MTEQFTIYCASGGHGRITLEVFLIRADGSHAVKRTRTAPFPMGEVSGIEDGEIVTGTLTPTALIPADDNSRTVGGVLWWGWRCLKCGRGYVKTDTEIANLIATRRADGQRSADMANA